MKFWQRPSAVAVCSVVVATTVRASLHPFLGNQAPLLIYILAILYVAFNCGKQGGLLTTVLSYVVGTILFGHTELRWTEELPHGLVFLVEGVVISIYAGRYFHEAKRALKAEREAEQLTALMEAAKNTAEDANKAKDKFISTMSHELRTPLSPVAATISLLKNNPQVVREHQEMLNVAERNLNIEVKLINDLLDISRIAQGKMILRQLPMSLHDAIVGSIKILMPTATAKQIELEVRLGAAKDTIDADRGRIDQVVWNIVGNAIKYTPLGGKVEVRTMEGEENHIVLQVLDSGTGIDSHLMERLFKPFEQGSKLAHNGGLGLGLSITRTIVEAHGGSIEADNRPERGCCMTICIPLTDREAVEHESIVVPPIAKTKAKLLLVEDHADTAELMARILRSRGYNVAVAKTVAEALAYFEVNAFDLMVSDLGLPDGSGHDIMKKVKPTGVKAIALSGYGTDEDKKKSIDAGFMKHITKPVNVETLEASIEEMLQAR